MNILFVHSNGIVPTAGGISRTTHNLVQLFRSKGHNVWLLGAKNKHKGVEYDEQQYFLPCQESADFKDNIDFLIDCIRSRNVQIVINQTPFSEDVDRLLDKCRTETGVKIVSCYHNSILTPIYNYAYQKEYNLKQKGLGFVFKILKMNVVRGLLTKTYIAKYRKAFRETSEKCDTVVLLCDGQVNEWRRMCGYSNGRNTAVIPNYMSANTCENDIKKEQSVLWVGTFDYAIKRPDLMLRIWKEVEREHLDWCLYMLGDGSSLAEMKSLSRQLGLKRVEFTGRVNPLDYYKKAKIQCVTSVHEAFPMVTVESMIEANPVIAFDSFTSASDIIIDRKNGILVEPFNIIEYSKCLSELMDNEQLCRAMGDSARKSADRFSPESVYALWQQLFDRL